MARAEIMVQPPIRYSPPLPPAIMGDKSNLSKEAKAEIQALSGHRPLQFTLQTILAWAVILSAVYMAEQIGTLWSTAIAIFLIASRQNILALLIHEQAHFLGFRGKWADLKANIMTAYPLLFVTVEGYAKVHLSHHRDYFTEKDPDLHRKSGPDWTFPMSRWHMTRLFLMDLSGLTLIQLVRGKRIDSDVFRRPHPIPKWVRPIFIICVFALIAYFGAWKLFAIYWLIPLIFVFPAIVRLGAISEHVYIPKGTITETSPLIIQRWYEKLLLPNLNFTMHPYHHWHPGVAWIHLPQVHRIYQREGLVNEANLFHGYVDYFRFLQTGNHPQTAPV